MATGSDAGRWAATRRYPFLRTPWKCRLWVSTAVVAAAVLPVVLDRRVGLDHSAHDVLSAGVLVLMSALNIEIGRLLEGGRSQSQRPHKALSTWSFASAIVLSVAWLLPVVAICYLHARWRGLRVPLWKWVGSAAYVVLAGLAAAAALHAVLDGQISITHRDGLNGLVAVLAGAAAFLLVETVLFLGSAYLNSADDEEWLRRTLAHRSFYLTESGVLLVGGLAAAVWTAAPWFLALLLPVFVLAQRAVLHEPLRERADHDDKTGLLRFESWHRLASASLSRCRRRGQQWSVVFADLDHFKAFNDRHGHLAGDDALVVVAETIRRHLRAGDIVGRFGGEEFCVFLPDVTPDAAFMLADRIRVEVASTSMTDASPLTVSVGFTTVGPHQPVELDAAIELADRALYDAKRAGRNATRGERALPRQRPRSEQVAGRVEP